MKMLNRSEAIVPFYTLKYTFRKFLSTAKTNSWNIKVIEGLLTRKLSQQPGEKFLVRKVQVFQKEYSWMMHFHGEVVQDKKRTVIYPGIVC